MNLLNLVENLLLGLEIVAGDGQAELSDLTDDSRRVTPGSLFVARDTGDERWRGFVADALERGAVAVVAPNHIDLPDGVSLAVPERIGKPIDQPFAGQLAAQFFGEPAKKLKLVGITGTNGKTTVATLTQYLLNAAGAKCGLLGTVAIDHGSPGGPQPAELTTPGAIDLHRHFAAMVANGCEACAMEVSSHALHQRRVARLRFAAAVLTNLTQDHLDYHGSMAAYAAAKARLFSMIVAGGRAVLPREDLVASPRMLEDISSFSNVVWTTSDRLMARPKDYLAEAQRMRPDGSGFRLSSHLRDYCDVTMPLVGEFNLRNVVQAVAAADSISPMSREELEAALEKCPLVPGRLEPVREDRGGHPSVLVDYAHTPDALENVLDVLRPLLNEDGKLIVVFGCGGDRDRTKRPLMAQAACGLADVAVLTSDNPRTEDPQQILDDAIAGVPPEAKDKLVVEIDRAKAIESAILNAKPEDTVLIAGKGHEDYQILGTKKIHFDDREHAAVALEKWVAQYGGISGGTSGGGDT